MGCNRIQDGDRGRDGGWSWWEGRGEDEMARGLRCVERGAAVTHNEIAVKSECTINEDLVVCSTQHSGQPSG